MAKFFENSLSPKTYITTLWVLLILIFNSQLTFGQCINFLPWPQQDELNVPEHLGETITQFPENDFVSVTLKDYTSPDGQTADQGYYFPNDFAPLPYSLDNVTLLYDFAPIPGFVNELTVDLLGSSPGTISTQLSIQINDLPETIFIEFVQEYQETFDGGYTISITPNTPNQFIYELKLSGPDIQSFRFGGRGMQFGELCYTNSEACEITEIIPTVLPCDANGNFFIKVDLEYDSPNDTFFLVSGTQDYIFRYDQLPVTFGPFTQSLNQQIEITVIDEFEECLLTTTIESQCPQEPDCNFHNIIAEAHSCTPNGVFFVDIAFDNELPGSEGFLIIRNGDTFGPFEYASPFVTVGPFFGDGTALDFIILDIENPFCNGWIEIDPVNCNEPCEIGNLDILSFSCGFAGGVAGFELDFDHNNLQGSFTVYVNEHELGLFSYSDLPVFVETFDLPIGNVFTLKVADNEHPDCHQIITSENPCGPSCAIEVLEVWPTECEAGSYFVNIRYEAFGVGSESIFVSAQGQEFGPLDPSQQPAQVGPFNSTANGVLEIWIFSDSNPICEQDIHVEVPNCGNCEAYNMFVEPYACDGDFFLVDLGFQHNNFGAAGFEIRGNGQFYGQFTLDDLPIIGLGPIEDILDVYEFIAIDLEHPDCRVEGVIQSPNCNNDNCEAFEMIVEPYGCDGGFFLVDLDFQHNNFGAGGFEIRGNGHLYGQFTLDDLPIIGLGPIEDVLDVYEFIAIDLEHPDCKVEGVIQSPNCNNDNCHIGPIEIVNVECDGGAGTLIKFNFDHQNTLEVGFDVFSNGAFLGFYTYNQLPVTVLAPNNNSGVAELIICDNDNPNCCNTFVVETPCNDCHIGNIETDFSACENGQYFITVNFDWTNAGGNGFELYIDNDQYGVFSYSDLPVTIGPFDSSPNDIFQIWIKDLSFDFCGSETLVDAPNCNGNDCFIEDVVVELGECNPANETYQLALNFIHFNMPSDSFNVVFGNNVFLGTYAYSDLPVLINHAPITGALNDVLFIYDATDDGCNKVVEYQSPNCTGCQYASSSLMLSECQDGFFSMIFNILEFNGNGEDGFRIMVNGVSYGDYLYNELPVEFGSFIGGAQNGYEVLVYDLEFESCNTTLITEGRDCEEDPCGIENVEIYPIECNENGSYSLIIDFDPTGNNFGNFHVESQNVLYGSYSVNDLPIIISEFNGSGNAFDVVTICNDGPNMCCSIFEFEALICGDCFIGELITSAEPCNANGQYYVELDFDYENVGSIGFQVIGNGEEYGPFSYDDLPVNVGPFEGINSEVYELLVFDIINLDCTSSVEFASADCSPFTEDAVWPGDANINNIANNHDLLHIGLAFGNEGPPREVQSTEWAAQASADWENSFVNPNIDFKHADCNGDGLVDEADIEVIEQNYNLEHGPVEFTSDPPGTLDDPALFVDFDDASPIVGGQAFVLPINLGTADLPVEGIYGIAFTIKFNPDIINPNTVGVEIPSSFIGELGEDLITVDRTFANEGKLDVAISRNNQSDASGFGTIVYYIGIIDDLVGIHELEIEFENLHTILASEEIVPLYTPENVEFIATSIEEEFNGGLMVYPNPGVDYFHIRNMNTAPMSKIRLFNALGQVVGSINDPEQFELIDTHNWAAGLYFVEIEIENALITKKIKIARK